MSEVVTSEAESPAAKAGEVAVASKPQPRLGRRLKALRTSRGLSLKEVAEHTGLSASFLSMIETGRNEMTVGRLVRMADFYQVGLADLIPERDVEEPVVMRHADRQAIDSPGHLVTTESLASWHRGDMSSRIVRFAVGGESRRQASPTPGPEFVLVLGGELTIEFSDATSLVLEEGDSIWFEASRRHRHLNSGDGELCIITFRGGIRTAQV